MSYPALRSITPKALTFVRVLMLCVLIFFYTKRDFFGSFIAAFLQQLRSLFGHVGVRMISRISVIMQLLHTKKKALRH